jgi:transcription initiation factor TFIIIB Brf1 subunit/transcription initiation factor TFIIB
MQLEEAKELRKMWGNKPCEHKERVKEYMKSTATGDYVCTTCGEAIWDNGRNDKNEKSETK